MLDEERGSHFIALYSHSISQMREEERVGRKSSKAVSKREELQAKPSREQASLELH